MGAFFCTDVIPSVDKLSRCLLPQRVRSTVLQERLATRPRAGPAGPKHKMPMVLLASQELAARAATRDQHLLPGAQTFVPENTSNIWVLTWQRPLKTIRGCILYC